MLLVALVLGVLLGYLRGGRLANLAKIELRAEGLIVAALVLQWLTPTIARALHLPPNMAFAVWLIAFALLLVSLWMNRDRPPLILAAAGVGCNMVVIALNGGMPVWPSAILLLDPAVKIGPGTLGGDPLYHLAGSATRLPFLADAVPVPGPSLLRGVISVGDVLLMLGVLLLVQDAMVYRGKRRISR